MQVIDKCKKHKLVNKKLKTNKKYNELYFTINKIFYNSLYVTNYTLI